MFLSHNQMLAVNAGLEKTSPGFSWVALPVGRQHLPQWAKGFAVTYWMMGWMNDPMWVLKSNTNLGQWEGQVFRKEGPRYMATSEDGRAVVHYHSGPVTLDRVKVWQPEIQDDIDNPTTVEVERWQTTQQEGYGGQGFTIRMADDDPEHAGKEITLRGPWHGGAPDGWMEMAHINTGDEWRQRLNRVERRPWWKDTAIGGLYITEDLFLRLVATYRPELKVARIMTQDIGRLVVVHPEWDAPKQFLELTESELKQWQKVLR